jgi:hypothetical protein
LEDESMIKERQAKSSKKDRRMFEISGIGTTKSYSKKLVMKCPALAGPKDG